MSIGVRETTSHKPLNCGRQTCSDVHTYVCSINGGLQGAVF